MEERKEGKVIIKTTTYEKKEKRKDKGEESEALKTENKDKGRRENKR